MKKSLFILIIIICANLSIPTLVFANTSLKYKLIEPLPFISDETTQLPKYLSGVFKFAIASIAIVALLMITIGGYYYIISAGNQAQSGRAKEIIWNAILGLVVVMFVGVLFYTINSDIMTFKPLFPEKMKGTGYEKTGVLKNNP